MRSWKVLGMLPGSNSMSIVSLFLHMLMHNANVGSKMPQLAALRLFVSLDREVRKKILQIMVIEDEEVTRYLEFLGIKSLEDVDMISELASLIETRPEVFGDDDLALYALSSFLVRFQRIFLVKEPESVSKCARRKLRIGGPKDLEVPVGAVHAAVFTVDYTERSVSFGWNLKHRFWEVFEVRTALKTLEIVSAFLPILAHTMGVRCSSQMWPKILRTLIGPVGYGFFRTNGL